MIYCVSLKMSEDNSKLFTFLEDNKLSYFRCGVRNDQFTLIVSDKGSWEISLYKWGDVIGTWCDSVSELICELESRK